MKFSGEKLFGGALTAAVLLGACGDDKVDTISKAERNEMIRNLATELQIAQLALTQGQLEYRITIESLPDDCEEAIQSFIPPSGSNKDIPLEDATQLTAEWCGPDNLGAVGEIKQEFRTLQYQQDNVNQLSNSLAANLAAAGVQPTPTSLDD